MTKIPFVQRVKRPDGTVYLYFRKGEYRRRLVSAEGTDELKAEVDGHLAHIAQIEKAQTPKPGTIGGALRAYAKSADFLSLGAATQKDYERLITQMETEIGEMLLSDINSGFISELRDIWATRGHRAANVRLQVLKNALTPAIEDERISSDPFLRIKKVKRPHDAGESHPIWEDSEVEAAIALAVERDMPGLARAIALGRWAGFRRGTICKIPLNARTSALDTEGRPETRLVWITEKRKVLADKREDPRLTAFLSTTPNRALTIAYNKRNQPWKERQLNQAVTRLLEALAKDGKARANLDIHGLRHSRGVELALAGASDAEIMSQLEHATDRAAKIYRAQADRRKLADAAQKRVDTVVNLRQQQKIKTATR